MYAARVGYLRVLRGRTYMLFVDGENFAKAGQRALVSAGIKPVRGSAWRRDVLLWTPQSRARWPAIEPQSYRGVAGGAAFVPQPDAELRRAYYYTSDTADEPAWTETRLQIRDLGFEPRLFKRRKGRSKAVDVALASDVLMLGATRQYEVAAIVAGDGDYVPLIDSVKRLGLHVGVAFIAADTSPELRIAADEYTDLTEDLLDAWRKSTPDGDEEETVARRLSGDVAD